VFVAISTVYIGFPSPSRDQGSVVGIQQPSSKLLRRTALLGQENNTIALLGVLGSANPAGWRGQRELDFWHPMANDFPTVVSYGVGCWDDQ